MSLNISRYYLKKYQARPYHLNVKVLPETMENLGDLIQRRMREVGISSKSELARRIGKSAAYVGDLINNTAKTKSGTYKPSPEVVAKLSEVLGISDIEILNAIGYVSKPDDDLLVADGLFSGYYDLTPEQQKVARKQIAAIIRSFKDEDFED